jgi:hypothetical protein
MDRSLNSTDIHFIVAELAIGCYQREPLLGDGPLLDLL